jgi:hypothetical protein
VQQCAGTFEKVVAPRADLMHSSPHVEATSTALRLEGSNLHPKTPTVRNGCRRKTLVVLNPCKRATISRAAAINEDTLSHTTSGSPLMHKLQLGYSEEKYKTTGRRVFVSGRADQVSGFPLTRVDVVDASASTIWISREEVRPSLARNKRHP